jgi:hypothetical protein
MAAPSKNGSIWGTIMKFAVAACFVAVIAAASGSVAKAADASYIGTWKLAAAVVAPWADPKRKPDSAEMTRLIGKTVVFQAKQIAGPPPFTCKAPHYHETDFAADMLFQGAFGEMQSKNKSVDPDELVASLGFAGKKIKTLETGCEMEFHFVDAATAEIGLNDYVDTLRKQ